MFHRVAVHHMHVELLNIPVIWMAATALVEFVQCETKRYVAILRLHTDGVINSSMVTEKHPAGCHAKRGYHIRLVYALS
jgi:hypothetical protein